MRCGVRIHCGAPPQLEGLAKLPPAFKKGGSTTAGNASQLSDGAGAVILAKREAAEEHGLPVLGRIVSYAVRRGSRARVTIGRFRHLPLSTLKKRRALR